MMKEFYTTTDGARILRDWGNIQARAKATRADGLRAYFRGVAIDENGRAVLYWLLIDKNGYEVGDEFTTGAEV